MFERIPLDLRTYPQWVTWRLEETDGPKPTKVPYDPNTGGMANVNDPATWTTFDNAVAAARQYPNFYSGIGFVLSNADPFTIVDLDDPYELAANGEFKHSSPDEVMATQLGFFQASKSYAERSQSGKGLHIIMQGRVEAGRKRNAMEVYSSNRFMVMTGDVYRDAPIYEEQELITELWNRIGAGRKAQGVFAGLDHAKHSDADILQIACGAVNGEKFADLFYHGNFTKYYASQSEADFALVDMLAFYSENREQVKNLFRQSALGQRDKAKRKDYVNYMLNRCFDRMLPPVDMDGLRDQLQAAIEAKKQKFDTPPPESPPVPPPVHVSLPPASSSVYSAPPGLVGEIAQFIYQQAPRPIPEIALAGAIGFMSGIIGRAYNISGTGLNQYMLLLAPTGTGKEAIASGIDKLMNSVIRTVPAAHEFIGPSEIASSQAVIKYMSKGPNSFVSLVGEFGMYLQQMASMNAPPHLLGLRRFILDAYNKSGEGKILRPSIYSDKDKNTAAVLAPSFSIMGESTPEKFYEGLHEGLISEGLLPRFTMIEYKGIVPPFNKAHGTIKPGFELIERLATVCANALQLNQQNKAVHVHFVHGVEAAADMFEEHCRMNTNATDKEVCKHLWSRAHMKALKLAAVVAVGINPYDPRIDSDVLQWAINLVTADVRNMLTRFEAGEIGIDNDETKQMAKVVECVRDFVTSPWSECMKYCTTPASLHAERIVPYTYISRRLSSVAVFRKDRIGATKAMERAIRTLCDRGDLQEVNRATLSKEHGTTAKAYMIATPRAFGF